LFIDFVFIDFVFGFAYFYDVPCRAEKYFAPHFGRQTKMWCWQKVAEKSALCVTGACSHLPVTSYPVTIKARENRRYGKHLSLGRRCFFFMQDMNGYGG